MYLCRNLFRLSNPARLSCTRSYSLSGMAAESKSKWSHLPLSTSGPVNCAVSGSVLLNAPYFNHGSAHTAEERKTFELTGLLPASVQTLDQQVHRAYEQYSSRADDLAKNVFLTSLKEQNLVLYYRVCRLPRICYTVQPD